ncbi:hypothetical protein FBU30_000591 [Linnemannia zychae]|nr:hypothetical protein FBU30_000591 [Linnemannia zychae]
MRIQWTDLKTYDIIGSGSFGRVFHGDLLGTEVAIKECVRSDSRAFDEKYFKREVDILRQSRHPNIVQFMGICKRRKRFYIITEFLPMGNLRRWIQDTSKEFGWDTRISFAIDISLALAYLHHKNIIHRDLKGENLLISENMRIKVCDFGFSRFEAKNAAEMSRISYCGTDGYMAPEILLGEDFDCSIDVFSFGVIISEMMARHVVDSQHFQRIAPDMGVSPDEILFRAQPGCPIELGELAIHCVQPLPRNRPKLREIVERLTAIENVDVHVGTTLVVAPSVARAARNLMRKKEVVAERLQEQALQHARMRQGYTNYDNNNEPQPHLAYLEQDTSSIRGQANTWRMTDESNRGYSSRITEAGSVMIGSQNTYKATRRHTHTDDSTFPLVLEAHYRGREKSDNIDTQTSSSSEDNEDINFRMPLWDSINSPYNLQELRKWHEKDSIHVSTIKGGTALRDWDQEREAPTDSEHYEEYRDHRESSQLSSLMLDLDDEGDGDEGGGYSFSSSGSSNGEDGNDGDSLFDNDDDDGAVYGHSRAPGESRYLYELSSDSDITESTNSLTESVVLALDNLEIPNLYSTKHFKTHQDQQNNHLLTTVKVPAAVAVASHQGESDSGGVTELYRKRSLASRHLPPLPVIENPWVSDVSEHRDNETEINDISYECFNKSTADELPASSQQQTPEVEEREMVNLQPPTPPSKTSLLLRNTTIKSMRDDGDIDITSPTLIQEIAVQETNGRLSHGSGNTSTTDSSTTSSSVSGASSPASALSPDEQLSLDDHPRKGVEKLSGKVVGGRNFGLIRGMSDSFWGPSTSTTSPGYLTATVATAAFPQRPESPGGGTITSTLVAAMSAKTWTSGVTGLGQWIGPATSPLEKGYGDGEQESISGSPNRKGLLKKHTSLKEGKQPQQQRTTAANLYATAATTDHTNGISLENDGLATIGATVKKRTPKTITGISHRFSLIGISALLPPKCDVCQKRLGVLPGWASKHLECDDCGYKCHSRCVDNVPKCCTSARKSGIWEIPV